MVVVDVVVVVEVVVGVVVVVVVVVVDVVVVVVLVVVEVVDVVVVVVLVVVEVVDVVVVVVLVVVVVEVVLGSVVSLDPPRRRLFKIFACGEALIFARDVDAVDFATAVFVFLNSIVASVDTDPVIEKAASLFSK